MTDPRTNAFDECFERLLAGESLEQVLKDYPQWAAEFRPLLETTQAALLLRSSSVPETARARSRDRLLSEARNLTIPHSTVAPDRHPRADFPVSKQSSIRHAPTSAPAPVRKPRFWGFTPLRLGLTAALFLIGLLVGSLSTAAVSAQALPGDALYPIKLITERTQLLLTKDPARRLELEQNFDQKRAREVNDLILRDRSATVNFAGGLQAVNPNEWLVDDIRVLVAPGTHITGELRPGYYVNVQGTLQTDGAVLATRIWTREIEVTGELLEIKPDQWRVDGLTVLVGPETLIQGIPAVGGEVTVLVTLLSDGQLQARSVLVVSSPPATATLEPTATPPPTFTERPPTRTPKPSETEESSVSDDQDTPEAEDTDEPEETPTPTDDDEDDEEEHETLEPTKTPKPTKTPESTSTPEPTDDDDEEETETPEADPTSDPEPTDDD